jgi:peroxisomal membrane protein 4
MSFDVLSDASFVCSHKRSFADALKTFAAFIIVHGSIIPHGERNTPTTTIPTSTSSSSSFGNALPGYPERLHHSFIAGAVGGFLVWGQYSSVNYQIILYLMSRVLVAAVKRLVMMADPSHQQQQQQPSRLSRLVQSNMSYRLVATVVWGMVMVLFEESPQLLHPSLKSSMEEIYRFRLSSSTSSSSSSLNGHHKTSLTI